jgi:hypothetical protein
MILGSDPTEDLKDQQDLLFVHTTLSYNSGQEQRHRDYPHSMASIDRQYTHQSRT